MTATATAATSTAANEHRQGEIGMYLSPGEQVRTVSGRLTTPFPTGSLDTARKAANWLNRTTAWLVDNAQAEAAATGSDPHGLIRSMDPKNLSASDGDLAEAMLFDPRLPGRGSESSILKPLVSREHSA